VDNVVLTFQLKIWVLVISLLPLLASAEIYRWTDASGKIHYSDKAPPGVKAEKKAYANVATPWRKMPKPEAVSDEVVDVPTKITEKPSIESSKSEELSVKKSDKKNNKITNPAKAKTSSSSSDDAP
jgi:hypothetical protein